MRIEKNLMIRDAVNILINIKDGDIVNEIPNKSGLTYSHICYILQEMEESRLITSTKKGRKKHIYFTEKGMKFKELVIDMIKLIKRSKRK